MAKYEEKPSEREKSRSAIITTEEGIAMVEEISQYMNALLPYIEKDRELAKEINGYNDKKEKIRAESNQYLDQIAELKASRQKFKEGHNQYMASEKKINALETKYGDATKQLWRLDWDIGDLRKEQEKNMREYKNSLEEVIPNNKLREKLLDVIKNRDKYRSDVEADKAFWNTIAQAFGVMPEIVAAAKSKK